MSQADLPTPPPEAIFYEDAKLYACLASFPICKGHSVVVWKEDMADLHLLNRGDYEYLMDKVDIVRDALMEELGVEKVYLMYLDEANQVHWHLIPRYNEKGFNVLMHEPKAASEFSLSEPLRQRIASIKI